MNNSELEKQALIGVQEVIAWHTVAIDISLGSKNNPDWGTGSLVEIEGRSFIVTCKHVVKPGHRNEDLRFLYRSEKSFQWVDKEVIQNISIHKIYRNVYKTFPREIPITNRIYSNDEDDLVLLEVDSSSSEVGQYRFFNITKLDVLTPEADTPVYFMGFSKELARKATVYGDIGVFPFFGINPIINKTIDSDDFNPEKHFLIDFKTLDDEHNIDPHGLSGCGVWSRIPSGPDRLWTANIYLVGVLHGYFRKSEVLKATRIQRIVQLVD